MRKLIISLIVVGIMLSAVVPASAAWYDVALSNSIGRSALTANGTWYLGGLNKFTDIKSVFGANYDFYKKLDANGNLILNAGVSVQWPEGLSTIYGPNVMFGIKRIIAKAPGLSALAKVGSQIGLGFGYSAGNESKDKRFTISIVVVPIDLSVFKK